MQFEMAQMEFEPRVKFLTTQEFSLDQRWGKWRRVLLLCLIHCYALVFGIFKVRPDIPAFNNVLFSPLCVMTLKEIRQQDLISFPYITFGLPWKLNS